MSVQEEIAKNFKYRNITVSGLPGSGSTTLLRMLKENDMLKFAGWRGFSGGEFMRSYAKEKGLFQEQGGLHHSATDYEDDFDRKVDYGMREKLQTESGWILESWLSGFMAQGVEGTLKILMVCSDKAVKVDRIVNRDAVTAEEAIKNMHDRYLNNLGKWSRMYKEEWDKWVVTSGKVKQSDPIDFWREDLYDIVIDTYSANQQEVLKIVLDAITK
ncbi:MAG: cytidylate kinase [Patescibacteria group bacterium]|nr:MAG: cytidylate kinase [Patescibacteria group bacterium]